MYSLKGYAAAVNMKVMIPPGEKKMSSVFTTLLHENFHIKIPFTYMSRKNHTELRSLCSKLAIQ